MNLTIKQEVPQDYDAIYQMVKDAFAGAEHSDGNEQDLVMALRESDAYIPELALVARIGEEIAGFIMFTRIDIGGHPALALAPLAVSPAFQRRGVGSALVRAGHRAAGELGFSHSLVLGSEKYYPRFGYVPASRMGIRAPFDVPDDHFMAVRLRKDAAPVQGVVRYDAAFGI